jgi:hypothetical protein
MVVWGAGHPGRRLVLCTNVFRAERATIVLRRLAVQECSSEAKRAHGGWEASPLGRRLVVRSARSTFVRSKRESERSEPHAFFLGACFLLRLLLCGILNNLALIGAFSACLLAINHCDFERCPCEFILSSVITVGS